MIRFGTGGWRAIIGDEFTKANIQLLAKAMSKKMKDEGVAANGIVMGYDRRFLSKETVMWSCEVFAAEGIPVYFVCRSVPTPLVMYYVLANGFPYGMMVTASHNTSLYNGIKIFTEGGKDASETVTENIEKYIDSLANTPIQTVPYADALAQGLVKEIYPMNEYIDAILAKLDTAAIRKASLRILLDPMYGVSQTALATILTTARCEMDVIHHEHDTLFGGKMPAPSDDRLKILKSNVVDKKYDLGLATDGDADRLGVIDDKGNYLHPNDILVLLYYYLLRYKGMKGAVVRNLSTTHRLDAIAEKYGQICYEVPVGFKHISHKMEQTDAILGGESSGGLTVAGHIRGKDGVYAASLLVEMVSVTGMKLSDLMQEIDREFGKRYMAENSYVFAASRKPELMERLYEKKELPDLSAFGNYEAKYFDGCKLYFANGGWLVIRFSGTEPLLRIFCEMPTKKEADAACEAVRRFLQL